MNPVYRKAIDSLATSTSFNFRTPYANDYDKVVNMLASLLAAGEREDEEELERYLEDQHMARYAAERIAIMYEALSIEHDPESLRLSDDAIRAFFR